MSRMTIDVLCTQYPLPSLIQYRLYGTDKRYHKQFNIQKKSVNFAVSANRSVCLCTSPDIVISPITL